MRFSRCALGSSQLCSPYSSSLKSHAFGLDYPSLRIPEPLEVWITCLSSMVPFKDRVVCVTSDDSSHSQGVLKRAREHFGNVVHVVASDFGALSGRLAEVPEGSTDAVLFCDNSFGNFVANAPASITCAHKALRKHGVLGIWGHHPPTIEAPEGAKGAFGQYRRLLDTVSPLEGLGNDKTHGGLGSIALRMTSIAASHDDIYFPFPSVAKRVFASELQLSPDEVIGVLRDCPQYCDAMTPTRLGGESDINGGLRLKVKGDPLNDLAGLCYNATRGVGSVSVQVKHFVITCDARPINRGRGQSMVLGGRRDRKAIGAGAGDQLPRISK